MLLSTLTTQASRRCERQPDNWVSILTKKTDQPSRSGRISEFDSNTSKEGMYTIRNTTLKPSSAW